ncbi:hypothetical protein M3Y99_00269800 [Aphelenchoides fujianensis]|nr:hypothetical protein M3Y99_00269800 [Aphelenchoides fujianensis]
MGNADSKSAHSSRRHTPTTAENEEHAAGRKRRSLSPSLPGRSESLQIKTTPALPTIQNSSASFHSTATAEAQHEAAKRRIQARRAKSFRAPRRSDGGSFRVFVCPITSLSTTQKKLIEVKWYELQRADIFEVGRNVMETLFRRDPLFLRIINLQHLADRKNDSWKTHIHFRAHVQRFCEALNETIRHLDDPATAVDKVHEFGASHVFIYEPNDSAHAKHRLPSAYWDALLFALNKAAKDLQVESSRGSESPSQMGYDRRFLLPGDESSQCTTPSPSPSPTPCLSLDPTNTPRRYPTRSVCPRASEAWNLLATYFVNQCRFGYWNEIILRQMLDRLQSGVRRLASTDEEASPREEAEIADLSIKTDAAATGSLSSTSNGSASSSSSSTTPAFNQLEMFALRRQQQTIE